MEMCNFFQSCSTGATVLIIAIAIWDLVWKLFAIWKAAKNDQPIWFVVMTILNTIGILPIFYLLTHKEKK